VQQSLLQQSTSTTWCCYPPASRLGWCSSASKPPPFSSKHNDGDYGQTVLFMFHQTRGHFSKKYDQLQTVVWIFLWRFWSSGIFLAERPFRFCRYRTCFTVDIDTFVPVSSSIFTRSFAVVLGLICTFCTEVRSSLGDRTCLLPEPCDGCVVPWCLYLHTIVCTDECGTFKHLEISPKDEPDLWRSTKTISEVLADFFWFSHDVKQRGTEFEGRPWNTPPMNTNDVIKPVRIF
jgi:hypothetical protein